MLDTQTAFSRLSFDGTPDELGNAQANDWLLGQAFLYYLGDDPAIRDANGGPVVPAARDGELTIGSSHPGESIFSIPGGMEKRSHLSLRNR